MQVTKETFDFLSELKENNDRIWFQDNKVRYDKIWGEMKDFVQAVIHGLSEFDPQINTSIQASKCLFRIYRDTRFSLDKTPYKSWLGAGISLNGRKLEGPEYYLHVQPGNSFLAVGYWRPKPEHLAAIRQEIDYNGDEFHQILDDLEKKRIQNKGFTLDRDEILKRPPSGYTVDHPDIELLKLKSFTLTCPMKDEDFYHANTLEGVLNVYKQAQDFKKFIHRAIGDD